MSHPRIANPVVGDFGTVIYIQLIDEDGTPLDPALATAPITATVIRPDQTEEEIEIEPSTNADYPATPAPLIDPDPETNPTTWRLAGGWCEYTIQQYLVDGDDTTGPWLNQAGEWTIRPLYELASPAGAWRAPVTQDIQVYVHA